MGLTPDKFYDLSPIEFFEALEAKNSREKILLQVQHRTAWESTRYMAFVYMRMTPELREKPKTVRDVVLFSWEEGQKVKNRDFAEMLKLIHYTNNEKLKREKAKAPS